MESKKCISSWTINREYITESSAAIVCLHAEITYFHGHSFKFNFLSWYLRKLREGVYRVRFSAKLKTLWCGSTPMFLKLKSDSHLPPKKNLFASMIAFKNDEKCFLFHLKALFVLTIFKFLSLSFWLSRKNDLIRKIRLISKFMTSQPG